MVAWLHAIPVPVLRFLPVGLAITIVVYSFFARRYGWRRRRPLPRIYSALGVLALIIAASLLLAQDIRTR